MKWFTNWFGGTDEPTLDDDLIGERLIVPDTPAHRALVDKLVFTKPRQFIFMTDDEMKLLAEIEIWPPR